MCKVLDQQKEFEVKDRELILKYNGISYISSVESKYLVVKSSNLV